MKKIIKNVKGITLIALVVTIIILLILAAVTINLTMGQNGLFARAKNATNAYQRAEAKEGAKLTSIEDTIDDESGIKYPIKLIVTSGGNEIVVLPIDPAGTYTIDWGDGTVDTSVQENQHTYAEMNKEYTVSIIGVQSLDSSKSTISGNPIDYKYKILEVSDWGNTGLTQVLLNDCRSLRKIASPRRRSFEDVSRFNKCESYNHYTGSFENCNSLISIPEDLFSYCQSVTDFSATFEGCSGLTSIPKNLFSNCYFIYELEDTFDGCTGLTDIPENLFSNCKNVISYNDAFRGCSGLTSIPENLFSSCPSVTKFSETFEGCTGLTSIPENLFLKCPNVTSFSDTFYECSGLTNIPGNLFSNCQNVTSFSGTFYKCTNLTSVAPELWKRVTTDTITYEGTPNGKGCFYNCTELDNYSIIPEYWKEAINL